MKNFNPCQSLRRSDDYPSSYSLLHDYSWISGTRVSSAIFIFSQLYFHVLITYIFKNKQNILHFIAHNSSYIIIIFRNYIKTTVHTIQFTHKYHTKYILWKGKCSPHGIILRIWWWSYSSKTCCPFNMTKKCWTQVIFNYWIIKCDLDTTNM